jgi:REP element-mobilizing transposase RayT
MPWGLTRFHHSGQSHFVTFCCYHRHRLFTADASCRIFESALERVRRSYRLYVYGYVLMPEHVHLLLSEPRQDTLADALKSLKQGVSRRLIPKMGGPLKPAFGLSGETAFLAKAVLRFQHSKLSAVCGEAALYSPQSGQARVMRASGGLAVEQLPPLRNRR